jgi:hypothetical protein
MQPNEILAATRNFGLWLSAEGGTIIVRPKGATPPELAEAIRAHKSELLALLANTAGGPPILREIAALPPAPCPVRGCPEHGGPSVLSEVSRPRERYPRDWRAPMALWPCSCGSRWWWLSGHGAIKCCTCNPPADLSIAEAWVLAREPDGRIPGEILAALHVHAPRQ